LRVPRILISTRAAAKPIIRMTPMMSAIIIETKIVDRIDSFSYSFSEEPLLQTMTEGNPRRGLTNLIILQVTLARDNFCSSSQDPAHCNNDICSICPTFEINADMWEFCAAKRITLFCDKECQHADRACISIFFYLPTLNLKIPSTCKKSIHHFILQCDI
jgi:hypothetical protein